MTIRTDVVDVLVSQGLPEDLAGRLVDAFVRSNVDTDNESARAVARLLTVEAS